jgi:hypothetical protein
VEHYVTLFDGLFLPQGLALHASLQRHAGSHTLWILCVDEQAYSVLTELRLPNVRPLRISDVETAELIAVKPTRTRGEYCWTLTPFAPRFVFEADADVQRVTYLDADLWFRRDPAPIFREFEASGKQVLITDHAYAPEHDRTAESGRFCVQFLTVTRDGGEIVRKWWEERCIEWCYARAEDGKYGDQKYLDDWPERFGEWVHVLADKELALAPWNATRFPYGDSVFYHFHGLRIISDRHVWLGLGRLVVPVPVMRNVYRPYLRELRTARRVLADRGLQLQPQARLSNIIARGLFHMLVRARRLAAAQFPPVISRW